MRPTGITTCLQIPKVRRELGEPPLVTPSSQIVGTQALFNVLTGERYKMVTKETKAVLMGEYGQTVKPFDPEIQKLVIGDAVPKTHRPADDMEPELERLKRKLQNGNSRMKTCCRTHCSPRWRSTSLSIEKRSRTGLT